MSTEAPDKTMIAISTSILAEDEKKTDEATRSTEEESNNKLPDSMAEDAAADSDDDDSSCVSSDDLADHRGRGHSNKKPPKEVKSKIEPNSDLESPPKIKVENTKATEDKDSSLKMDDDETDTECEEDSVPKESESTERKKKAPSSAIAAIILGAAAMSKLTGNENRDNGAAKPKDTSSVQSTEKETKRKENPDHMEDEQDESDTTSMDEESTRTEEKSIEKADTDSILDDDELKKRIAAADAATRAVAEDMIRKWGGGKKETTAEVQGSSESSDIKAPVSNGIGSKSAPPADDASKEKPTNPRNSHAGKESLALEMELKSKGIAQSDQLRSTQFPFRLHNMLDDAERSGHAHIVSWCKGGDSFKIHDSSKLIRVLQKYFRQSKFKSFLRQLQGYNFKRITRGKDQGVVSHPLFIRGRRSMSTYMKRKRVGPKAEGETNAAELVRAGIAGVVSSSSSLANNSAMDRSGPNGGSPFLRGAQTIPQQIRSQALSTVSSGSTMYLRNKALANMNAINPEPQDVLCVDVPNVQNFQGNRKLTSIVKKITGHYTSATETVKNMIVNEIATRIQKGGSRFLKLSEEGTSWLECNGEEICRKVISSFEGEINGSAAQSGDMNSMKSRETLHGRGTPESHGVATGADTAKRQDPPREQDVVLRGGPSSEKEGNTYLITMIQANVGQQVDSFEMKRIKCRAILERMKRRGSRFFLKLKDTDSDDEMYILSDAEAQDVIYTAFCAEEKKMQSLIVDTSSASSILQRQALARMDIPQAGLAQLGGASQFSSARAGALQSDAALLSQLRANSDIGFLSSQASLKRPLESQGHFPHEDILEKRLRAETDEHMRLLLERARHQRGDPYGDIYSRLPLGPATRSAMLESALPTSAYAGTSMEQLLKERQAQADELLLKSAVARGQFPSAAAAAAAGLGGEIPKANNNNFVEFLKKKYVNGSQGGPW